MKNKPGANGNMRHLLEHHFNLETYQLIRTASWAKKSWNGTRIYANSLVGANHSSQFAAGSLKKSLKL